MTQLNANSTLQISKLLIDPVEDPILPGVLEQEQQACVGGEMTAVNSIRSIMDGSYPTGVYAERDFNTRLSGREGFTQKVK